jgi:hypothetical protein
VPQNEVFVLVLWHTEQQFLKSCEEPIKLHKALIINYL